MPSDAFPVTRAARELVVRLALTTVAVLATSGCATSPAQKAAEHRSCEKLVAATRTALDTGHAPLDPETAAFARARGLQANIVSGPGGMGQMLVPRLFPFPLMAASAPKDGGPQYRASVRSLTPEYLAMLADEGRRCQW